MKHADKHFKRTPICPGGLLTRRDFLNAQPSWRLLQLLLQRADPQLRRILQVQDRGVLHCVGLVQAV
jgi:hypothetical protein